MLDYQINESIAKAYLNRVCRRRMNEGINDVETVSTPLTPDMKDKEDFLSTANDYFADPEGYERRREEEERKGEIERRERLAQRREEERRRQEEYERNVPRLVASSRPSKDEPQIRPDPRYAHPSMSSNDRLKDPGMRIGDGVYKGLAIAAPLAVARSAEVVPETMKKIQELEKSVDSLSRIVQSQSKGGGFLRPFLSPTRNAAGAGIGVGASYGAKKLREQGHDKIADAVEVGAMLPGFSVGPTGYLGATLYDKWKSEDEENNADFPPNAKCTFDGCDFHPRNQKELNQHFMDVHGVQEQDLP